MKSELQPHVSPGALSLGQSAGAAPTRIVSMLALLAGLLFATGLQAADAVLANHRDPASMEQQPLPFSLNDTPLAHDSGFNAGNYFADAFSGASSNYYLGRRLVRLGNGDVVVAGLVPQVGAANVPGRWNLGMVRYNSAGQRVAWANPGANGHFGNQYIVTPNNEFAAYTDVVDIVASETAQDRIYVMLNTIAQDGTPEVNIIAFGYDGSFQGAVSPFLNSPGSKSGAGLVYYREGFGETYKLVVIGTRFDNGKGRPVYRRYNAFGFNAETGVQDIHPTIGDCSTNIQSGGCIATAVTSVQWSAFEWLPPRIYVAGVVTRNLAPDDTDFFVTRIKGGDGTGVGFWDGSFGTGGTRSALFDAGGNNRDYATGVAARRGGPDPAQPLGNNTGDEIYVVGQVAQACQPGIGIAAFNHNGTSADFGAFGKQRFGGTSVPCNQAFREVADYANAVTYNNDRLVIVGFSVNEPIICFPIGSVCEDAVDPMVAIVRGRDGWIQEHRDFPVQPGNRVRHGGLYDVVVGGGGYTATGDDRYFDNEATPVNLRGRQEFTTVRFREDRIFGNGLNCGGGFPDYNPPGCP